MKVILIGLLLNQNPIINLIFYLIFILVLVFTTQINILTLMILIIYGSAISILIAYSLMIDQYKLNYYNPLKLQIFNKYYSLLLLIPWILPIDNYYNQIINNLQLMLRLWDQNFIYLLLLFTQLILIFYLIIKWN